MFNEYDEVIIKVNGMEGTIVDKTIINGNTQYVVEGHAPDNSSLPAYGGEWPLYDCKESDIMPKPISIIDHSHDVENMFEATEEPQIKKVSFA